MFERKCTAGCSGCQWKGSESGTCMIECRPPEKGKTCWYNNYKHRED